MGLKEVKDNYQKLGSKGFANKWRDGMKQIPQATLLKIDLWSIIGNILGTALVCILLIFLVNKMWWLLFAFIFNIGLQISQFISKYQQLKVLKMLDVSNNQEDIEKMMKEIKKDVE